MGMESTLNSTDQLRSDLSNHLFQAILAFDTSTQEPAGFTLYTHSYSPNGGRFMQMTCLYARKAYQGLGLANILVKELAQIAKKEGLCKIEWDVREWNVQAKKFYDKV